MTPERAKRNCPHLAELVYLACFLSNSSSLFQSHNAPSFLKAHMRFCDWVICRWTLDATCKRLLGKQLDKSEQLSNWEASPLSDAQVIYAALDTLVLLPLFYIMRLLESCNASPSNSLNVNTAVGIKWHTGQPKPKQRRVSLHLGDVVHCDPSQSCSLESISNTTSQTQGS